MEFINNHALFRKAVGIWLILLTASVVLGAYLGAFEAPRNELNVLSGLVIVLLGAVLLKTLPRGGWSICFIFFTAFAVFHMGLILADLVGGITDPQILYVISFWYDRPETENAVHLVNLALIGFSLAAILFSSPSQMTTTSTPINPSQLTRIYHLAGLFLVAMVGLFFVIGLGTGVLGSYGAYLATLQAVPILGTVFAYLYLFIGIGLVLLSVTYRRGFPPWYFVAFALWALIAFKLGLRGEVMFPATSALCMLGRRGAPVKATTMVAGIFVFLIVTGIVKNARISGDYSQIDSINPMNAVAEMGSSLRAVQEVVRWRKEEERLLMGGSYWVPIERQLALVIPGLERIPANEDPRMLNLVVQERAGPIGFSPVAEAYLNFGELGVPIVLFLFGALLASFDNRQAEIRQDLRIGVILVPLFVMIRNSFTPVPVQILIGLIMVSGLLYVTSRKGSERP